MTRTTDCLKCNFPRDEPKGARVCKKCGRQEGKAKGAVARTAEAPLNPLANFLEVAAPTPEPALYVAGVVAAVAAVEKSNLPPSAPSNTAAPGVTNEGATPAATVVDLPADPPTVAGDATLPAGDASSAISPASTPSAATAESETPATRGHSPLGGSRAKQFMNCTGSTALIAQLGLVEGDTDSEYSKEGHQAHELAARCLNDRHQAEHLVYQYPLVKPEDAPYVQAYVDYVRSRPGRRRVEIGFHRPLLHSLYWGMIDAELVPVVPGANDHVLEIVDFKFGAGVYVPVERNAQMMYYAGAVIMEEDEAFFPDEGVVRLTIHQPRLSWVSDPVRSWDTTVGEIKRWVREECLPAMNVRTQDMVLSLGDWCQFCPAKLVCRAMTELYKRFSYATDEPLRMSDEQLGSEYAASVQVRMRIKAIEQEVTRRLMEGGTVPLAQLVRGKTDRVWKDKVRLTLPDGFAEVTIEDAMRREFGEKAWQPPKLMSPAMAEALPGGKSFVATYAYQPEAPLRAALVSGGKPTVQLPSPEEKYGDASKYLDAQLTA